jgi:hypothetical protein
MDSEDATIDTTVTRSAAIPPLQRYGVIETDRYCRQCSYNLHGLTVERDERLDLLVIRCPEGGTFDAAGQATTVNSLWLSRVGTILIVLWVFVLLWLVGLVIGGTFGFSTLFSEVIEHGQLDILRPAGPGQFEAVPRVQWHEYRAQSLAFLTFWTLIAGAAAGIFVATCFWHVRKARLIAAAVIIPFLLLAIQLFIRASDSRTYSMDSDWQRERITSSEVLILPASAPFFDAKYLLWCTAFVCYQSLVLATFIAIGRPIARGLLRILLPLRLRQSLVFLWRVDGKDLPTAVKQ